jgi:hypothetical protein
MNKAQALQQFWSSFGLPAYDQYTAPQSAQMPYITYSVSETDFDYTNALTASLWYRSSSWEEITLKSYEISKNISRGGKVIPIDDGKVWIYRGSPFSQRMSDVDDTVRRIIINITVEYFTND